MSRMKGSKYLAVVFVESRRCRDLDNNIDSSVLVKYTFGSKEHAVKRYGIPDDDYDFAVRFLETCRNQKAVKCIAVVRDYRIAMLIAKMLREDRYSGLISNVEVYILREFQESRDAVCGKLKHIIEYVNMYIYTMKHATALKRCEHE